jgi:hypothetical protein
MEGRTMTKPKLIPNWRKAWRMFSVQSMTAAAALQGAWAAVPVDLKDRVPGGVIPWLTVALLVLGVVGRLIDQPKVGGE